MYDSEEGNLKHKIEQDELGPPISATTSSYVSASNESTNLLAF